MKLLLIADVHGDLENIYKLRKFLEDEEIDAILLAGDLTNFGPAEVVDEIMGNLKEITPYIFAVPGNTDPRSVRRRMEELGVNIHNRRVSFHELDLVGFEGANWVESEAGTLLAYDPVHQHLRKKGNKTLLLTHVPPFNTNIDRLFSGQHVGSIFLRDLIEEYKPDFVVSGHIHEARGIDFIGRTLLVNPGPLEEGYAAELDLSTGEVKFIDLKKEEVEEILLKHT